MLVKNIGSMNLVKMNEFGKNTFTLIISRNFTGA